MNVDNSSGSHVIKSGVELAQIAATQNSPNNNNGTFGFLTDTSSLPNTASIAVGFTDPNGLERRHRRATGYTTGLYINDEWRIKPNFTLSLGVRHDAELNTMNNDYTVPWASDPVLQGIPELKNYLNTGNRKNQLGNISPRVSFSWDPMKNNRTFLRGGLRHHLRSRHQLHGLPGAQQFHLAHLQLHQPGHQGSGRVARGGHRRQVGLTGPDSHEPRDEDAAQPADVPRPRASAEQRVRAQHRLRQQHMDNLYVQRNPNYLDKTVTPNKRKLTAAYGDILLWDESGSPTIQRCCCRAPGSAGRRA